jgi:hypothetical protein
VFQERLGMAATYAEIIAALDDAILAGASRPVEIEHKGKRHRYETLDSMIKARAYFAGLQAAQTVGGGFHIGLISNGGSE